MSLFRRSYSNSKLFVSKLCIWKVFSGYQISQYIAFELESKTIKKIINNDICSKISALRVTGAFIYKPAAQLKPQGHGREQWKQKSPRNLLTKLLQMRRFLMILHTMNSDANLFVITKPSIFAWNPNQIIRECSKHIGMELLKSGSNAEGYRCFGNKLASQLRFPRLLLNADPQMWKRNVEVEPVEAPLPPPLPHLWIGVQHQPWKTYVRRHFVSKTLVSL